MVLTPEQMNHLKEVELDLLQQFVKVCDKLELNYFIVQGTLIGAVRHKGFIPWDDDIDVGVMRKDYEILVEKGQELLPEGYFLQTHENDPGYPQCFAKIRKTSTSFVETTVKNCKMNHGIYIDVFPFDYYPERALERKIFEAKKFLLKYRVRNVFYVPADNEKGLANTVKRMLMKFGKVLYPTLDGALAKQKKLFTQVKESSYLVNNGSPWGTREIVLAEWMKESTVLEFEGIKVKAPIGYDQYLTKVYGDYMTLPPEEKRIPHHYISYLNFDESYEKHQEQI